VGGGGTEQDEGESTCNLQRPEGWILRALASSLARAPMGYGHEFVAVLAFARSAWPCGWMEDGWRACRQGAGDERGFCMGSISLFHFSLFISLQGGGCDKTSDIWLYDVSVPRSLPFEPHCIFLSHACAREVRLTVSEIEEFDKQCQTLLLDLITHILATHAMGLTTRPRDPKCQLPGRGRVIYGQRAEPRAPTIENSEMV